MAKVLAEYFGDVYPSDIHDHGYGVPNENFLTTSANVAADFVITNPPFGKQTLPFVVRALDLAKRGVAMFVRSQWYCEGLERYETILKPTPPTLFAPFTERVNLCRGRWDPDGTTATAYCWVVWLKDARGKLLPPRPTFHIPPGQREALTHTDDRQRFARWTYEMAPEAVGWWIRKVSAEQIAKKLGISPGSVRSLVKFGLKLERDEETVPMQEAAE